MRSRWGVAWQAVAVLLFVPYWTPSFAHDPDALELEVPEVQVVGERPPAASSQQFIPDREYLLQPQGRPAQVLRL
ncbi:MAG TPA: TonB-dependent receptor, partial [Nitrospira sp.]|nr:TonB-dependent receptor [Nitrospira sp.]